MLRPPTYRSRPTRQLHRLPEHQRVADAAKLSAQASARAASDANVNPARRNSANAARTPAAASDAASETKADTLIPVPPETTSVTQHSIRLDGRKIDYTATAGNLLLRNNAGAGRGQRLLCCLHIEYEKHRHASHHVSF